MIIDSLTNSCDDVTLTNDEEPRTVKLFKTTTEPLIVCVPIIVCEPDIFKEPVNEYDPDN